MPSLQCPDCGERHALDGLGGAAAFRCRGCERVLKVPAQFRSAPDGAGTAAEAPSAGAGGIAGAGAGIPAGSGAPSSGSWAGVDPAPAFGEGPDERTRRGSANATAEAGARRRGAAAKTTPLWLRVVIWIVAIPLGAVLVFGVAEALGVLTSRQLIDTFLESGMDRFGAVARLLPFWAVVSAALVHLAVVGLDRRRASREDGRDGPEDKRGQRRDAREPARAGS